MDILSQISDTPATPAGCFRRHEGAFATETAAEKMPLCRFGIQMAFPQRRRGDPSFALSFILFLQYNSYKYLHSLHLSILLVPCR